MLQVTNLHAKSGEVLAYFVSFNIRCFLALALLFLSPVCALYALPLFLSVIPTWNDVLLLTCSPLQMQPYCPRFNFRHHHNCHSSSLVPPMCCGVTDKQCTTRGFYFYLIDWLQTICTDEPDYHTHYRAHPHSWDSCN